MKAEGGAVLGGEGELLAESFGGGQRAALEEGEGGAVARDDVGAENEYLPDAGAGEGGGEPVADGFDFGKFGHGCEPESAGRAWRGG